MLKSFARATVMAVMLVGGLAQAAVQTLSGRLDDAANTALIGSFGAPPVFTADPLDSMENVALYAFNLAANQAVRFQSLGYAAGGIDPYVSLFSGTGDPATFVRSFAGAAVGDFDETVMLLAGDYTVAIGLYMNMSFAENYGSGTLGDGFTGLGGSDFGDGSYRLLLTTSDVGRLPEPGSLGLLLVALAGAVLAHQGSRLPQH
ncbi:DVUA0089 family protein [Pelomonas sp. P7]|uniref:DVUA0089 family protein n=1 Tax=Pelomonas caseinilytica TaxID=2906763 RepID=A0ABS8XKV6_9BURK|nr:DVUA0089 family protein [Pelomonas sp. P7]MCE4537870.1 DVUA0089 family protein [Pelomonas sp. P7]